MSAQADIIWTETTERAASSLPTRSIDNRGFSGRVNPWRLAVILVIVAAGLVAAWRAGLFALGDRAALLAAIERARGAPYATGIFVLVYALAAAIGVPATPFTLAGGALFGGALGFALNWVAEMCAALLAFGVTRVVGIRAASPADRDTRALTLFRLRLIPVAPFALLNAGAALSGISWRSFAAVTAVGIVPVTAIYTIASAQLVAGVAGSGRRAFLTAVVAGAVLVAASFLPALLQRRGPR